MGPLTDYMLHLGDTSLILGQRLSEWCGHGPALEQDIAMTNIALDLIGQARLYYQHCATLMGDGTTEDNLAYFRNGREFKNHLLVELPNGGFGQTIVRQFFFDHYHYLLLKEMTESSESHLRSIAAKSIKEVAYHRRFSTKWVLRLGDGTEESRRRVTAAVDYLWPYALGLYETTDDEKNLVKDGVIPDVSIMKKAWEESVVSVLEEATIKIPEEQWAKEGGKNGFHTEYLDHILAEMQQLQRVMPGLKW